MHAARPQDADPLPGSEDAELLEADPPRRLQNSQEAPAVFGPKGRRRSPAHRRSAALLGTASLLVGLAACGTDQDADTEDPPDAGAQDDAGASEGEGPPGGEETDGDAEEGTDQDDDGQEDGAEDDAELAPHLTENEVYSWDLPEGWTAENEVTHEELWPNGEPEQTVEFFNPEGEEAASANINIATSNDGAPPQDVQLLEAEPLPEAEQPGSETYVRTSLVSDCTEADEVSDPQSECGYFVSFSLVSLEEGQDIEDDQEVWVFQQEVEGEDHGGNVLMGSRMPDEVSEDGMSFEGVPYEEAQELAESEEYSDLWELYSSFGHHVDGSAQ